jgi:hypothetical protein
MPYGPTSLLSLPLYLLHFPLGMRRGNSNPLLPIRKYRGRAITQAVSHRLPTAAARVRAQLRACGICGGQSGTGQVFSEYFGSSCQFSFHRLLHTHHPSSGAGNNRPVSGRRTKWTQSHPTPKKPKLNSVAVVHKRTIPTERSPLVGEVSANLCG